MTGQTREALERPFTTGGLSLSFTPATPDPWPMVHKIPEVFRKIVCSGCTALNTGAALKFQLEDWKPHVATPGLSLFCPMYLVQRA
mmetsp:Transcript_32745/g.54893  ORF Transcript_32745/g.54893 Transcript_32745/m.54893 type:complete len:86 (-) Transcript_32745:1031-1288(-)